MYNEIEIGKIIRELRGDLSLREFAKQCDISHTTIDNLEKGFDFRTQKPTQVTLNTLYKIAKATNVSVGYIIGEANNIPYSVSSTSPEILTVAAPNLFFDEYKTEPRKQIPCSSHEELLLLAYRLKPEMQHSVDILLGIADENEEE